MISRPLYFVMHMNRLASDAERVAHLMETKYKTDILLDNKIIVSHSIEREAQLLRSFPLFFRGIIETAALIQPKDFFGNKYEGYDSYDFIEMIVSYDYKTLSSIRFLGTKDNKPIRFSLYSLPNIIFDPTTLNIVSQIRALSDSIDDFFGKVFDLFCSPGLSFDEDISNIENTSKLLTRINQVDVTSSVGWYEFVTSYFAPTPIIVTRSTLTKEDLDAIEQKFNTNLFKSFTELQNEASDFFGLKSGIANLAKNGFEINNTAKAAFFTDLDKQIQTLGALYSNVFDVFTLGCLISEALDCIRPPISCPDLLRELPPDVLKARIALAFPLNPQVLLSANKLIDRIVEETKNNNLPQSTASDRILDELATIIDVDAICSLKIPFAIPKIELPTLPTIDLLFDINIQLDTAILEALAKALIDLILGILKDLFDCGKLDNFIAGLMNGQINDDSGAYGDLAKLFTDPQSLTKDSAVANSFGNRWTNFVNQASPMMSKIIDFNATGSIGTDQVSFNKIISGDAGLVGLQSLLLSGNFQDLGTSLQVSKQPQDVVLVDVTNLGHDNHSHQFLKEVSGWDLSSDENSFTLNNLTDERITIITHIANPIEPSQININKPSQRSQAVIDGIRNNDKQQGDLSENTKRGSHEEKITGEEIFKEIGKLFDTIISVLSPTETINLLAGKATLETLNTVLEIVKIRHKRLYLFINTIQKIATVFELFGKSAGLDTLRDKLLLLTASPDANRALIPALPCPPFEDVFKFRKELLKRTLPEDQVITIIDDLMDSGKKRFHDIQDGLVKIKTGLAPVEALKSILCGTGKSPNGQRSPVVEDSLNSTIGLMFDPTRMMFDREIGKYVEAISTTKETSIQIPRKATMDGNIPIFNPASPDGSVFSSLSSLLGLSEDQEAQDKQSDRINLEFKKMIDSGFIPTKKTGDGQTDFQVDGSKDKDYTDGEEPVFRKDVVKKPGAAFKDGIKFTDDDIDLDLSRKFKITLKGSLDTQSPVSSFTPFKVPSPEWIIEYTEKGTTTFNIRTGGQIHSSVYGLIPFSENYRIQKDEIVIDEKMKQEIFETTNSPILLPRQDVFSKIFENKILPHIQAVDVVKESFSDMLEERFENFIKATIREIGNGFAQNRLLKKVPNNSLTKLAPEGMSFGSSKSDDLIALNLINFSPVQTEKQRLCNIEPHLLDFDSIKKIVKDRFDKECEEENQTDKIDGLKPRRGPINSAGFVGLVMTVIRLYTIEYILRGLFVLDEFKFSKDFSNDDLLIDYITFRMQSDIERMGFYKEFEKEALVSYRKLLEDGVIQPYSNKINACADVSQNGTSANSSIKNEMKALVKFQLESAMERVATILGIDTKKEANLKTIFFDGLEMLNTFSDFGESTTNSQYTSINQRMTKLEIPKSGKFVLERYIRVKDPSNLIVREGVARAAIKLEQDSTPFLNGVVNFRNWEEFISKVISNNSELHLQHKKIHDVNDKDGSLFEQPWKIGLRLVYVPPAFGEKIERRGLQKNVFKITKEDGDITYTLLEPNIVDNKKSYYLFDKQISEPSQTDDKKEYFKQYNPIPILEKELEITDFINFGEARKNGIFEQIFEQKYFKLLKEQLLKDVQMDVLIDYCLFSKRLLSLFMIHSTLVLNGEQMKFLFEGTKQELKKLFFSLQTLGSYVNKNEFKLKGGNAGEFQRKFNRIGDPSGPSGPDAFYYWSTTPIHIIKALAIMTDPNIFWADKIVAAAASGFLSPKLIRLNSSVRIEGTNQTVNAEPGIVLDNEFKVLETGEVVKLKTKLNGIGKPFIEYSPIALIQSIVDGVVTLKQEQYPDGTNGPAIRTGAAYTGVPWDRSSNAPASGINLDNFNALFDQRPSAPIYPGEKINLPYGLASLALTPMQVFATILGPLCRTMYNPTLPLGQEFLALEPLIYQLPHYQIASANTDVATDLKETGLDLKGAENIGCDDKNNTSGSI